MRKVGKVDGYSQAASGIAFILTLHAFVALNLGRLGPCQGNVGDLGRPRQVKVGAAPGLCRSDKDDEDTEAAHMCSVVWLVCVLR
jgi:hypothetical protein